MMSKAITIFLIFIPGDSMTGIKITRHSTQSQRNHNISIIETFHFHFYIVAYNNKQLNSTPDSLLEQEG